MKSSTTIEIAPIGVVHSPRKQEAGMPNQSRWADQTEVNIEVFPEFAEGLKDLDGIEQIWLVYWSDDANPAGLAVKPCLHHANRGIFATRAPMHPNPIGMSAVRLLAIENRILRVSGVGIRFETALLDIKPYDPEYDSIKPKFKHVEWQAHNHMF